MYIASELYLYLIGPDKSVNLRIKLIANELWYFSVSTLLFLAYSCTLIYHQRMCCYSNIFSVFGLVVVRSPLYMNLFSKYVLLNDSEIDYLFMKCNVRF